MNYSSKIDGWFLYPFLMPRQYNCGVCFWALTTTSSKQPSPQFTWTWAKTRGTFLSAFFILLQIWCTALYFRGIKPVVHGPLRRRIPQINKQDIKHTIKTPDRQTYNINTNIIEIIMAIYSVTNGTCTCRPVFSFFWYFLFCFFSILRKTEEEQIKKKVGGSLEMQLY